MRFVRVVLFIAVAFVLGCGKSAPPTELNSDAAKAKEEAEKNAQRIGDSMKTKIEFMNKGGPPKR
jgi:hypothetical protein